MSAPAAPACRTAAAWTRSTSSCASAPRVRPGPAAHPTPALRQGQAPPGREGGVRASPPECGEAGCVGYQPPAHKAGPGRVLAPTSLRSPGPRDPPSCCRIPAGGGPGCRAHLPLPAAVDVMAGRAYGDCGGPESIAGKGWGTPGQGRCWGSEPWTSGDANQLSQTPRWEPHSQRSTAVAMATVRLGLSPL